MGGRGAGQVAGSCGDFLLRWQASCSGRGLETKGPTYGPEIEEKDYVLTGISPAPGPALSMNLRLVCFPHLAALRPDGLVVLVSGPSRATDTCVPAAAPWHFPGSSSQAWGRCSQHPRMDSSDSIPEKQLKAREEIEEGHSGRNKLHFPFTSYRITWVPGSR